MRIDRGLTSVCAGFRSVWAREPWLVVAIAGLIAVAIAGLTPVPQDRTALVLRLGAPVAVINGWTAHDDGNQAGLSWRMPLIDRVVWLDRRQQTVALDAVPVTSRDGKNLVVDGYALWRVTDPARFYAALGTPDHAANDMRTMLAAVLRRELAQTSGADLVSGGAARLRARLRLALDRDLATYGASVSDADVSRVALPDGAGLDAAYMQMAVNAQTEAAAIAAQGQQTAQGIRADATARAGAIYAASFGKDPEFYDFYRAMQSYDTTFAGKPGHTTMVISPDNAYLRQFRGK